MDARREEPTEEILRLQRCIDDMFSLLEQPAILHGADPGRIVPGILDVLSGMLQLDLIYVRLSDQHGAAPTEFVQVARSQDWATNPALISPTQIGRTFKHLLDNAPQQWPSSIRNPIGDGEMSILPLRLGLHGEIGVIVAGSQRADFPRQTELLLLSVAAKQATIGLQAARLLAEQQRTDNELDQRVARRIADLVAINEKLRQELAESRLAEKHLRQAANELRLSEARKAAIVDSVLDCIVTIDHTGRITEFNPAAEQTFGYSRDEVLGRSLADVMIPPAMRQLHQQGMARYLATGETRVIGRRIELTALRADGTEFPVELAITRIPSDGPPTFTGYLRDITQRKRSEEELRRSQAFLAETRRLSSTGGFFKRVATGEIVWSEEVYRIFEFDPTLPLTLERILTRVHPEDIHSFNEMLDRQRRGTDYEHDYRLLMPDQSVKYLHVVAHATRHHDGQLEYMAAVQDVTQRRLAEEALAKARSELAHVARATTLGALTASIAHEVNQPLSGIITNASTCLRMLAADPPNVDGARETARRTIRDGNRASEVITRLRALFSKKHASTETVDLNEAAREVIALSLSELQQNQVILRQELKDDLPSVTGDRVQLQQVILNLLLNASDAMRDINDRPRLLVVRTEHDKNDHIRLSVQDAGTGFDPKGAAKLFDAFYTTKSGGMGIGLSVSRSIIESHRGRLWATPNDGAGATFAFSVPLRSEGVIADPSLGAIWTSAVTDTPQIERTP
jgi:PAS domain S-box-containing protein